MTRIFNPVRTGLLFAAITFVSACVPKALASNSAASIFRSRSPTPTPRVSTA